MKKKKSKSRKQRFSRNSGPQGSLIFSTERIDLTLDEAEKIRRNFGDSGLDLEACDGPGCRLCQLFAGQAVQRNFMH